MVSFASSSFFTRLLRRAGDRVGREYKERRSGIATCISLADPQANDCMSGPVRVETAVIAALARTVKQPGDRLLLEKLPRASPHLKRIIAIRRGDQLRQLVAEVKEVVDPRAEVIMI